MSITLSNNRLIQKRTQPDTSFSASLLALEESAVAAPALATRSALEPGQQAIWLNTGFNALVIVYLRLWTQSGVYPVTPVTSSLLPPPPPPRIRRLLVLLTPFSSGGHMVKGRDPGIRERGYRLQGNQYTKCNKI